MLRTTSVSFSFVSFVSVLPVSVYSPFEAHHVTSLYFL